MADMESLLKRWQAAGLVNVALAERIRAWEAEQRQSAGLRWQGVVALVLGAILLASGVILFVSANWDKLSPGWRYTLVMLMVAAFHVGGALARERFHALSTTLHAVGTLSTGAAIALVGQIFNIQEHWPDAILMWAIAALAGWALLHDEAQQTLTLLLFPAWLFSELAFDSRFNIGQDVYLGRYLLVWATLYLTVFLGSRRRVVQGVLLAVSAVTSVVAVAMMMEGWRAWSEYQSFLSLSTRIWAWSVIAVVPLAFSLFGRGRAMIPVLASLVVSLVLPWCTRSWIESYTLPDKVAHSFSRSGPSLLAYLVVGAFTVFLIWWGVRAASRALVNLSVVGFGVTVGWFYFGNIYDKMGRSVGLIGLGVLFLILGWLLEKTRRKLMARIAPQADTLEEAP
jgi:uncharacterized membrane protein